MNYPPPNSFLHNLFLKSNGLLSHCGPSTSLVILAPVSSSLNAIDGETGLVYADNLTDEFVQSHILRVVHKENETLDRTKARVYTTINNKSMVIKEDIIYPHRGFRGVKEVRILHDSLFWLDDLQQTPYLVYFLDRPLMGVPRLASSSSLLEFQRAPVNTWAKLVAAYSIVELNLNPVLDRLYNEFNEALDAESQETISAVSSTRASRQSNSAHRTRRQSGSSIAPAPLVRSSTTQSYSSSSALQFLSIRVDLVINSAMQAFQMLPQATLHAIAHESDLTGTDVEKLIESHILNDLYDIIFFKLINITQARDEEIAAAIEQTKYADISQLGISATIDLRRRLELACKQFKKFGLEHEPLRKVQSLVDTLNVLMLNSEKSSDDLVPSLVYVVLRAGVSNLCANLVWIREFSFTDVETGEYGFALSTLEAVLFHITSTVNSLATISTGNLEILNAVKNNDLNLVQQLIESNPSLLDIWSPEGESLHKIADMTVLDYLLSRSCSACNLSQIIVPSLPLDIFRRILEQALKLSLHDSKEVLNTPGHLGQTLAHRIYERPEILNDVHLLLDWEKKDQQGNTPLLVLARIYDHPLYDELLERIFRTLVYGVEKVSPASTEVMIMPLNRRIKLRSHVDAKGNTLAHVTATPSSMKTILDYCIGDFNATNDKGLTPLLISIKFARTSIVELLLARPEVDFSARDVRGHSAIHYAARGTLGLFNTCIEAGLDVNDRAAGSGVTALHIAARDGNLPVLKRLLELDIEDAWDWRGFKAGDVVKNDMVRSMMDDWACRGREVRVLRGHVGDDCLVKYLIKSKSGGGVLRSASEFVKLKHWMTMRYPAHGIASLPLHFPSPCLLQSRPARSILLAVTERLDAFVRFLLEDQIISQDPILWEFLLSPIIKDKAIVARIEAEVAFRRQETWRDEKALTNLDSTQIFFTHAREQIMQLSSTYKVLVGRTRATKESQLHLSVAYGLVSKALATFKDLQHLRYVKALEDISDALINKEPSLMYELIEDIISLEAKIQGLCHSLKLPDALIDRIDEYTAEIARHEKTLTKAPRLNLAILVDSQTRRKNMIKNDLQDLHIELKHAGSELRYNEAILAGNLSTFYQKHERTAVEVLRRFASKQVVVERSRLDGMEKALASLRSAGRGDYT